MRGAERGWAPVAALLAASLVVLSVEAGLRLPPRPQMAPLAPPARLGYEARLGTLFSPLRDAFVAYVLGLPILGAGRSPAIHVRSAEGTYSPPARYGTDRSPPRIVAEDFLNDDLADAYEIQAVPFTGRTDASRATREPVEPADCSAGGGTIWYRHTPRARGGLVASTFGTRYPTALGVYRRADDGQLTRLRCDVDAAGNAQVVFSAEAGTTYWFQVAGPAGGGRSVFTLDPLGRTVLVSAAPDGQPGKGDSWFASVSGDGRYVVFMSFASNLVPDDTNGKPDVFVRDLVTRTTEMVSVSSTGAQGDDYSWSGAITPDGRYVAFFSWASNLVPGDSNRHEDVFVHDRLTRRTERVSVSSSGSQGWVAAYRQRPGPAWAVSVDISPDGRYVAFDSDLAGLVPDDTNACSEVFYAPHFVVAQPYVHPAPPVRVPHVEDDFFPCRDVFVHDRAAGVTRRASVSSLGEESNGDSGPTAISRDGLTVVFSSSADNLVAGDNNHSRDVFVHDFRTGTTRRVSVSADGEEGNSHSGGYDIRGHVNISDDGRYVAFISEASNLVAGDSNAISDVFRHDRHTLETLLVTRDDGHGGRSVGGHHAGLSSDGRYVAVGGASLSSPPLANTVYLFDAAAGAVLPACVDESGDEVDGCVEPDLSADGSVVVYYTRTVGRQASQVYLHELPAIRGRQ